MTAVIDTAAPHVAVPLPSDVPMEMRMRAPGARLAWRTETPPPAAPPADDRLYVMCRCGGYERPVGQECGLPCL